MNKKLFTDDLVVYNEEGHEFFIKFKETIKPICEDSFDKDYNPNDMFLIMLHVIESTTTIYNAKKNLTIALELADTMGL